MVDRTSLSEWPKIYAVSRCFDVKGSVEFQRRGEERGARERGARVSL